MEVLRASAPWAMTGFILGMLGGLLGGFGFTQTMKAGGTLALGGCFAWLSVKGIKMIFYEDNDRPGGKGAVIPKHEMPRLRNDVLTRPPPARHKLW